MTDVKYFEKILRDQRAQLQQRLQHIEHELDQPGDPDAEERATEREWGRHGELVGFLGSGNLVWRFYTDAVVAFETVVE